MTDAILTSASKPLETSDDRAAGQRQMVVHLVQERDDGLTVEDKAKLLMFFSSHPQDADMYIELNDETLRKLMIDQWIARL